MKKNLPVLFLLAVLIFSYFVFKNLSKPLCGNNCKESFALQIEHDSAGIFQNQSVNVPTINPNEPFSDVLGTDDTTTEKHIYVDLSTQTLLAYEGKKLFMKTPISSGLWGRTPTGDFKIWRKVRSTRMSGGSGADYYNLPNVPYVMFFSNNQVAGSRGFSFHGTYWHNNFGHPMSHGCVNMKTSDAGKLFSWVDNFDVKITIYQDSI